MKTEDIKTLIESFTNMFDSPSKFFTFLFFFIITFLPLIKKVNQYINFSEIDIFFIPKHEVHIQRTTKKVLTYAVVIFIYGITSFFISAIIGSLDKKIDIDIFLSLLVFIFIISLLPLLWNMILLTYFKPDANLRKQFTEYKNGKNSTIIFNINYSLSYVVNGITLATAFSLDKISLFYFLLTLFAPGFYLHLYRMYYKTHNQYNYHFEVINDTDFNNVKPIIKYSLDKDKLIFEEHNNDNKIYIYDKSVDKYFKITKVEV